MEKNDLERKNVEKLRVTTGITLVALVVTIVVLLILAGITITYVFGDNSIFNQALNAKIQTELAKIEEKAEIIYTDKVLEKVKDQSKENVTEKEVIDELKNWDCKIEEENKDKAIEIKVNPEKVVMLANESKEISVEVVSEKSVYYYVIVEGKRYRIKIDEKGVSVDRTPSNIELGEDGERIKANSSKNIVTIGEITENTVKINSSSLTGKDVVTIACEGITKTLEVTVAKPIDSVLKADGTPYYYLYPAGNGEKILCFGMYNKDTQYPTEISTYEGLRRIDIKSRRDI